VITYTVSITLIGDLDDEDQTSAEVRADEIANGLQQLAQDLGLSLVVADAEVEEL
jgi:hypothetical protein